MQYIDGITIVVPVYNSEKTLKTCVDSIINQTYKNWNLILVDDGSTDNSAIICDEYEKQHSKISVIHKQNGGVSSARNAGLKKANTRYIIFIDSDDFVDKNYLDCFISTKKEFPDAQHIWCSFKVVDADLAELKNNKASDTELYSKFSKNELMSLHKLWQLQGPVCKLYSLEIINKHNLYFNEAFSLGEDLIFNMEYLDACDGEIVIANQCLYSYYKGDEGLNTKFKSNELELRNEIYGYIKKYLDKWSLSKEQYDIFYNTCFLGYDFAITKIVKNNKLKFIKKAREIRKIICSVEFKNAFEKKTCYTNSLLKIFYRLKLSVLVLLFYSIVSKRGD